MTLCVGYPGHARLSTIRMSLSQPGDGAAAAFPSLQELPDPIICHMTSYLLHPELVQLSMLSRWVSKRRETSPDAFRVLQLPWVLNSHSTNFDPCDSDEALCEYCKARGKHFLPYFSNGIKEGVALVSTSHVTCFLVCELVTCGGGCTDQDTKSNIAKRVPGTG